MTLLDKATDLFLSQHGSRPDGREIGKVSPQQNCFEKQLEQLRGHEEPVTLYDIELAAEIAKQRS